MLDKMPITIRNNVLRIIIAIRFSLFVIKSRTRGQNISNPERVYWISPDRIVYHTNADPCFISDKNLTRANYRKNNGKDSIPFRYRVFDSKTMRGKVLDGDWDITNFRFTDLDSYKALQKRIKENVAWQDTKFYKGTLRQIESGQFVWGCKNKDDLDKRIKFLDSLSHSIKNKGYRLNREVYDINAEHDEIDVNIGRDGKYLFQNGRHRLAIAKILGIKYVPVRIFVRHKKWQEFRKFVVSYAQKKGAKLYQPIVHPDFVIPFHHNCQDRLEAILSHLGKKRGVMLDLGANLGFFCHKFEDLGYRCYAIENSRVAFQILEKIKMAENKKFKAINKSIFEVEFIKKMEFDVALALNIFHHFLKRKRTFFQLKDFLKNLKTEEMFFQPHRHQEDQMKEAYVNYTETEFVEFILRHTSLNNYKNIYTASDGRHIFKLEK